MSKSAILLDEQSKSAPLGFLFFLAFLLISGGMALASGPVGGSGDIGLQPEMSKSAPDMLIAQTRRNTGIIDRRTGQRVFDRKVRYCHGPDQFYSQLTQKCEPKEWTCPSHCERIRGKARCWERHNGVLRLCRKRPVACKAGCTYDAQEQRCVRVVGAEKFSCNTNNGGGWNLPDHVSGQAECKKGCTFNPDRRKCGIKTANEWTYTSCSPWR